MLGDTSSTLPRESLSRWTPSTSCSRGVSVILTFTYQQRIPNYIIETSAPPFCQTEQTPDRNEVDSEQLYGMTPR